MNTVSNASMILVGLLSLCAASLQAAAADPVVQSVNPPASSRQVNKVSSTLEIVLADGDLRIDENAIVLQFDGRTVAAAVERLGRTVTVNYAPEGLQVPADRHIASVTFSDTTGAFKRTQQWTFYNLKNLVLPTAKIVENFDSYREDTQPTGWVAKNFTARVDTGRDITSETSESYENWVVVRVATIPLIDNERPFNVNPGQTYNGREIKNANPPGGTFPDWLMSGNVLYAESDGRNNQDALNRGYFGQTQIITTKPFDCSQIKDPVLSFSSVYEQNQDSMGAVEYSVDAGNTWLPIVYFLDTPDIVLNPDGSVDAVKTFTNPNLDTSAWKENGVAKGGRYGDAIGAAITSSLGPYIVPRIDDDAADGKRIEVFRLPQASRKSDVRLRFVAMGTDSWYFIVDNVVFYDVPGGPAPLPIEAKFNAPTVQGANIGLSWSGSGTLEQADALAGPWTSAPNQSNPQTISVNAIARFYRLRQ